MVAAVTLLALLFFETGIINVKSEGSCFMTDTACKAG